MFTRKDLSVFLLVFSLFLLLLAPDVSLAEPNGLKALTFDIDVKPEYDNQDNRQTLVIYQGQFVNVGTETIKKDTPISFIIPKDANIGMACEINAQGGHECQPYTTKDLGEDKVQLSWKITKDLAPNQKYPVYLEFYYDNKSIAPNKNFDYKFFPSSNIDTLNLSITAPKAATGFATNPSTSNVSRDNDGLTAYHYTFTNQTPDNPLNINVSYVKADNKPTFDKPQVGGQAQGASTGGGESWITKPVVLIPTVLLLLVLGIFVGYALRKPQAQSQPQIQNKKHNKASAKSANSKQGSAQVDNKLNAEKRKIRQLLLDGKISEETYRQLIEDLQA